MTKIARTQFDQDRALGINDDTFEKIQDNKMQWYYTPPMVLVP